MGKRLEVALTSDGHDPGGGFPELSPARVYTAADNVSKISKTQTHRLKDGDGINLGDDCVGRPLHLEAHLFTFNGRSALTLLDTNDRILFSGDALGMQGADGGVRLSPGDADMRQAFGAWRSKTDGKYDVVYTTRNYQWYTSATYVEEFSQAITRAALHDAQHMTNSKQYPGSRVYTSDGPQDVVASILVSP
jgi:glyoxylase-like metal-dependent hydrolase (beta-lactamase superfamily II)